MHKDLVKSQNQKKIALEDFAVLERINNLVSDCNKTQDSIELVYFKLGKHYSNNFDGFWTND